MKELIFADVVDEKVIDVRTQTAFQAGHLKNALNLNPGNFKKYLDYFVGDDEKIVVVIDDVTVLDEISHDSVIGYLMADSIPEDTLVGVETIPASEFLGLETDYILLDVRTPDEITRPAPEKNLLNIPFEDLPKRLNDLDQTKTIYTLCGSGNRSTAAASYLLTQGFDAQVIEGGMKAVQAVGE
ncbi:rhodanese-like domain-containing protein [Fundicoccus culcitae]|uniref:Rhodanese-like domain-containing protein n=1 Tax=Fundicoccus culcitae TaxID=2969821 RepID=A0ABY5P4K7_9LACT|nr:rhodanese-like domain-containing protein [Fundicoccus culcitae]UUX33511.1 rhodanese-like domain-containing protein [Fundicoccus culcitae]